MSFILYPFFFILSSMICLPTLIDGEDKSSPFKNCIRKNLKHIKKWAKRTETDCFRLYDRDIKEYPLTIDYYAGRYLIHLFSFDRAEEEPPVELQEEIVATLSALCGAKEEEIFWKSRIRRKRLEQYVKLDDRKEYFVATEYGVKFLINLTDYLDNGLFLDHRESRQRIARQAKGKSLLNLFAYTCSFSVQAAFHGARFTKSVDLSNTYTEWGKQNFLLNSLSLDNNEVIRADCLKFLDQELEQGNQYDLIVVDPPTLSRSKAMDQLFTIQLDYSTLLAKALKLLAQEGTLLFSTNFKKFHLDCSLFEEWRIMGINDIPFDFHNKKIHNSWIFQKKGC